jgi:hypothetical protein
MSRRCKPGIRARVIGGTVDVGRIVVVVRRYFGEEVSGAIWPRALFPWVVTSTSGPLSSVYIPTGAAAPPSMTIVLDDKYLEPLDDCDGGLTVQEGRGLKKPSRGSADIKLAVLASLE